MVKFAAPYLSMVPIQLYGKNVEKSYFEHLPRAIFRRFQMRPSVKRVLIICSMAVMPIYGKNTLKSSSPESRKL